MDYDFIVHFTNLKGERIMEKIVEISNLTKVFSNGRGIFDISVDVYKGDVFGFLGPNGAGKTTAMKIMVGLSRADSGDVKLFGHSIQTNFKNAMVKVGCIVETVESYPYLTAYENLKQFSRYYKGIDDERIEEVLEITGILKFKNEKTKNFSLGMKQRLGISSALLSKPELVILDEPLNGLDVEGMLEIRNLIKKLAKEQYTTFFISSHLIHDVELTCNKVGIIYNGKIVNIDSVQNILNNYSSLENYFVSEVDANARV
jgi:ABC-2 type transport system ATP-binding protein